MRNYEKLYIDGGSIQRFDHNLFPCFIFAEANIVIPYTFKRMWILLLFWNIFRYYLECFSFKFDFHVTKMMYNF